MKHHAIPTAKERALDVINTWDEGQYLNRTQEKANLQILIIEALEAQDAESRLDQDIKTRQACAVATVDCVDARDMVRKCSEVCLSVKAV